MVRFDVAAFVFTAFTHAASGGLTVLRSGTPITVNLPQSDAFEAQSNLKDLFGYLNSSELINQDSARTVWGHGCGSKPIRSHFGAGEFATHSRTYFSGWIG